MLELSSKYAIRALSYLSTLHSDDNQNTFVQVQSIAKKVQVPAPYLAKLLKELGQAGILETKKGVQGGVRLAKRPTGKLSFWEICASLSDPITQPSCLLNKGACNINSPCPFHEDWSKIQCSTNEFLKNSILKVPRC
ncbi:Rrf2 family transcriptional regulator [bacterium]|nr:Rrf2 family transcriptional regulator [bacterium]